MASAAATTKKDSVDTKHSAVAIPTPTKSDVAEFKFERMFAVDGQTTAGRETMRQLLQMTVQRRSLIDTTADTDTLMYYLCNAMGLTLSIRILQDKGTTSNACVMTYQPVELQWPYIAFNNMAGETAYVLSRFADVICLSAVKILLDRLNMLFPNAAATWRLALPKLAATAAATAAAVPVNPLLYTTFHLSMNTLIDMNVQPAWVRTQCQSLALLSRIFCDETLPFRKIWDTVHCQRSEMERKIRDHVDRLGPAHAHAMAMIGASLVTAEATLQLVLDKPNPTTTATTATTSVTRWTPTIVKRLLLCHHHIHFHAARFEALPNERVRLRLDQLRTVMRFVAYYAAAEHFLVTEQQPNVAMWFSCRYPSGWAAAHASDIQANAVKWREAMSMPTQSMKDELKDINYPTEVIDTFPFLKNFDYLEDPTNRRRFPSRIRRTYVEPSRPSFLPAFQLQCRQLMAAKRLSLASLSATAEAEPEPDATATVTASASTH